MNFLDLFDIPLSMLPEVKDCDSCFGTMNINGTKYQY